MASDVFTPSRSDAEGGGRGDAEVQAVVSEAARMGWDSAGALIHLSHEIRTPLNSILALSQLLRDGLAGELNADQRKYVEVIERNGQNLIRLVDDVLDLSRLELGHMEVNILPLDLGDQLRATTAALAPLATAKGLQLVVGPCDHFPPVRCDPDRLRQILTNLLGNAIKFTDRGQVTLSADLREQTIAVHVTDSGIGIPEEARKHLFEEFFQASGEDRRKKGGAGLGLAIASRLVRLMGGDLAVQSTVGIGSRFTFTLPLGGAENSTVLGSGSAAAGREATEAPGMGNRGTHRSPDGQHGTNTAGR